MSKKKVGIIIGAVVLVAAVAAGGLYFSGVLGKGGGSSSDKVYVETVSTIMGSGISGNNRYSGVIEPQESWDVNKDEGRTVAEVFVEVGDEVAEGAQLFSYDVEELDLQLEQQKLELEGIDNEISDYNSQIADLQKEKASAPADQQLDYTTRIQSLQTSIKQSEYNRRSKEAEMEKTKKSMENSVVTSKIAGVVKAINDSDSDEYGNRLPYMTILATGEYQVKGAVNEQNRGMISEGLPVIVRSRVDEELTWSGSITKLDTENTISNNNNGYYSDSSDEMTTSSKYPFYVALDSMDGLILGQHVYIELDMGLQPAEKEGVWLYSYYIVMDDGDPYVWASNGRDKLEKRVVELGEYDENLDQYEIKSGLTEEDLIAFPMPGLYEGVTTVTNPEEVDYDAPLYQQDSTESPVDDEFIYDTEYPMDDGFMYNTEFPMEGGAADGLYREVTDINENDIDGMVPAGMDDDAEVAE
jgi:HlyD family secretion protein